MKNKLGTVILCKELVGNPVLLPVVMFLMDLKNGPLNVNCAIDCTDWGTLVMFLQANKIFSNEELISFNREVQSVFKFHTQLNKSMTAKA